jgi:hypothetical protein
VGIMNGGELRDSNIDVYVSGREKIGGAIGYAKNFVNVSDINIQTGDYWYHKNEAIDGNKHVGGLIGYGEIYLQGSSFSGNIHGKEQIGGLIGYFKNGKIFRSHPSDVRIEGNSELGGAIGFFEQGTIEESKSTGDIKGTGENIGGFIGAANGDKNKFISNCYSEVNVEGDNYVAGFVASPNEMRVKYCYSIGEVKSNRRRGGFSVSNGLEEHVKIIDSFWGTDKSGLYTSSGGEGKSSEEMAISTLYEGWDPEIWYLDEEWYDFPPSLQHV